MRVLAALLATALLAACNMGGDERIGRSGENVRRDVPVGAFDSITLAGPHDVIVTTGATHSVRVEGDSGLIDNMEIAVRDGSLRIGQKKGINWPGGDDGELKVFVTAPALKAASMAGSGDITIDRVEGEAFNASIAGSGDVGIGQMAVRQASFSIAGSGDITAAGTAETFSGSIAGSGEIEAAGLRTRQAKIDVAGSGNVSISASETAEVNLLGSGNADIGGGARCTVNKRGSGEARCG